MTRVKTQFGEGKVVAKKVINGINYYSIHLDLLDVRVMIRGNKLKKI